LLYPKILAGRLESSNDLRANVEVNDGKAQSVAVPRQINIEEVRELSMLTLRLEALCTAQPITPSPGSPIAPLPPGMEMTPSKRAQKIIRIPPPVYLAPAIRDDMDDDELTEIIESLTTRIENSMSTMVSSFFVAVLNKLTVDLVYQTSGRVRIGTRSTRTSNADRPETHGTCHGADERCHATITDSGCRRIDEADFLVIVHLVFRSFP